MPGDVARQHTGIGRLAAAANERHAHPGHRAHAKALQEVPGRGPAADEDEILRNRDTLLHRPDYAQVLSATPVVRRNYADRVQSADQWSVVVPREHDPDLTAG